MAAWAVGQTRRFKAALMGAGISDWGLQTGIGELGMQEAGLGGSCGWQSSGPHRHQQLSPGQLIQRSDPRRAGTRRARMPRCPCRGQPQMPAGATLAEIFDYITIWREGAAVIPGPTVIHGT
jgi:hypothetical protein